MHRYKHEKPTTCPSHFLQSTFNPNLRSEKTVTFADDETENIDFTTEFRATARAPPPRRRPSHRRIGSQMQVRIHEGEGDPFRIYGSHACIDLIYQGRPSIVERGGS